MAAISTQHAMDLQSQLSAESASMPIADQPMQTAPRGMLPGETILTFGVKQGCGFVTLSAANLTDRQTKDLMVHVLELARRVSGNLAIDAALVRPFNCHWINSFIELHHRCRQIGGRLILTGLPEEGNDIIRSTGLTKVLTVTSNREEAFQLFQSGSDQGFLGRLLQRRSAA